MKKKLIERQKYQYAIDEQVWLIHKAVAFFIKRMETNMAEIKEIIRDSKENGSNYVLCQWETDFLNFFN